VYETAGDPLAAGLRLVAEWANYAPPATPCIPAVWTDTQGVPAYAWERVTPGYDCGRPSCIAPEFFDLMGGARQWADAHGAAPEAVLYPSRSAAYLALAAVLS
jgi:hypothetical protein